MDVGLLIVQHTESREQKGEFERREEPFSTFGLATCYTLRQTPFEVEIVNGPIHMIVRMGDEI